MHCPYFLSGVSGRSMLHDPVLFLDSVRRAGVDTDRTRDVRAARMDTEGRLVFLVSANTESRVQPWT